MINNNYEAKDVKTMVKETLNGITKSNWTQTLTIIITILLLYTNAVRYFGNMEKRICLLEMRNTQIESDGSTIARENKYKIGGLTMELVGLNKGQDDIVLELKALQKEVKDLAMQIGRVN